MGYPLSKYFSGIAAKRLSAVEIDSLSSNQHEFNGIQKLREILGTEKVSFDATFLFIPDEEDKVVEDQGILTWYDARENHPSRTEYRLYYPTNAVFTAASVRDLVVIGKTGEHKLVVIVTPSGSTTESQLLWLFGLPEAEDLFTIRDLTTRKEDLGFAGKYILASLGVEILDSAPDYLEQLLRKFGSGFPPTRVFSDYARSTVKEICAIEEPDETLLKLLEQEKLLFMTLEKHFVAQKLKSGFGEDGQDVDDFISYSLSIQNRRKSRAGYSFENHLEYIFNEHGIHYDRGQKTERNNKPDFLFPGIYHYRNHAFDPHLLTMLGVKTTAKDRWRQVLAEAERIEWKHLITIETPISESQMEEMVVQKLQLVIPKSLMEPYPKEQQKELVTLTDFIDLVKDKQRIIYG